MGKCGISFEEISMRKLLIFLITVALVMGAASALPMFGPAQGFRNPGNIEFGGTLSVGGADIVAGSISYDDVIDAAYANETAINSSIDDLTDAAYTNETAINATAANVAIGQTRQNTTLTNLAYAQTAQNTTLTNLAYGHHH
jgi:hypothetical protein